MPARRACKASQVAVGKTRFLVVPLSEPLRLNARVYPGDPKPSKKVLCDFPRQFCRYNIYTVGDHAWRPHGDAPRHHNPELGSLGYETWGPEFVFNRACLLDLSRASGRVKAGGLTFLRTVTAEHLRPFRRLLSARGAVLLRTGYDRWLAADRPHKPELLPHLDESAADFLAGFKNLRVVGVDSLTVDAPGKNYAHRKLKDKFLVESLPHLDAVPAARRGDFLLQASPVAIEGATGGPVMAYAWLPAGGKAK